MHRRTIIVIITATTVLSVVVPAARVAAVSAPRARATSMSRRVTACGVERWSIKTGTDPDARLVDPRTVVPTNIIYLRALPAPAQPPLTHRVRPVETTVWGLDATLVRYKQEDDSDYHLVLSDAGGRTMIAEIPAPACVGASSPFLPVIRAVRAAFTAAFHPTTASFQGVAVKVHVTGVGFFDVKHGQSGVAPNAIELHPILSIQWGGGGVTSPPAATTTPAPVTGTPRPSSGTPLPALGAGGRVHCAGPGQSQPDHLSGRDHDPGHHPAGRFLRSPRRLRLGHGIASSGAPGAADGRRARGRGVDVAVRIAGHRPGARDGALYARGQGGDGHGGVHRAVGRSSLTG